MVIKMDDRAKETLLNETLDSALDRFHMAEISDDAFDKVFESLMGELRALKNLFNSQDGVSLSDRNWKRLLDRVAEHPLMRLLRTDPFTGRVLPANRNRGSRLVEEDAMYAAHHEHVDDEDPPLTPPKLAKSLSSEETEQLGESVVTNFGRRLWLCGPTRPNGEDIKLRHEQVGKFIDRQFETRSKSDAAKPFHLLSVPCGRCRHVRAAKVFCDRKIDLFVAMDPDGLTLDSIGSGLAPGQNIRTVRGGVDLFLNDKLPKVVSENKFDVVVCTDRLEYLSRTMCARVIASLWRVVRPGGSLVYSNLRRSHDLSSLGTRTLQLFPHWGLVRRTMTELSEMASDVPVAELAAAGGGDAIEVSEDASYCYAVVHKGRD